MQDVRYRTEDIIVPEMFDLVARKRCFSGRAPAPCLSPNCHHFGRKLNECKHCSYPWSCQEEATECRFGRAHRQSFNFDRSTESAPTGEVDLEKVLVGTPVPEVDDDAEPAATVLASAPIDAKASEMARRTASAPASEMPATSTATAADVVLSAAPTSPGARAQQFLQWMPYA